MEKIKYFNILWNYIKDDKLKLFCYIFLVALSYIPSLIAVYFWGVAIETLTIGNFNKFVIYLLIYEGIYILFYTILQIPRDYLYNYFEVKFTKNVSKDLYKKVDMMPAVAFENMGVGEFTNRLSNDPDRIMELLSQMIRLICRFSIVIIILIASFKISLLLGCEILLLAIMMGFISARFFPHIKKSHEKIKKESDNYTKIATENISGIREIKSLGIKSNIENKVFTILDNLYDFTNKSRKYERWYYAMNNLAYFIIQFIIFFTCGSYYINGIISLSIFMMIESYIWRIDEVVENISSFGVNFNKVTVSLKRIDEILNNKLYQDEKFGNKSIENINGVVEFKNVKFKYNEDEEYTLKNLNLKIEPYKKIAIVGKSGNGKSTIFNLLLRYFDVSEGEILIDDINIKEFNEQSLRNSISIIRQNPFLFNLSILDNFRLVKENVTLEEVRNVCHKAYIDDYIMSLPKKYDTIIGEGGINLSGGQKQRIAIARTLLLNTKIILFDEATSALDNESQSYIKKTIDKLVEDHTVIIVAHRLSTIVDSDIINVMNDGRLLSSGTHKELLKKSDIYKNLYLTEEQNM